MTAFLTLQLELALQGQFVGAPGLNLYVNIQRFADGYFLDSATLDFSDDPVDPDLLMTEMPAGVYTRIQNCTTWDDGEYIVSYWEAVDPPIEIQPTDTVIKTSGDPLTILGLDQEPLNENTGGLNNLQYTDSGTNPIDDALIRVFRKIDWDNNDFTAVLGSTRTKVDGTWYSPIFVTKGDTYVIVFQKEDEYGPNIIEVTV